MSETEDLREKYAEILRSNGIHDTVAEVIVKESGSKGDGLASLTQCVTVKFESEDKAPLNLFIKLHTGNPSHEAMLESLKAFEKESRFLMEYLPEARQFCKSKGLDDLLDFYPKCYYADTQLIVLENLILDKGYALLPHEERHDFTATAMSLKLLAKHHAASYAMIQECGGKDKFFQRFPDLDFDALSTPMLVTMMVGFFQNSVKTGISILEKNVLDTRDETLTKLKTLSGDFMDVITDARSFEADDVMVLLHGDYKNNNLMFLKDGNTDALRHLIAIDFQGVTFNPPTSDLVAYLFSSVDPKLRQTRLQELLNMYLDTLNAVSKDLGYPIELSYEDLLMQYRKKFKFGFFFGLGMVGPGMGIVKLAGMDVSKLDMTELGNLFHQCLLQWVDQNPEKGKEMANEIKDLVEEYNKLEL